MLDAYKVDAFTTEPFTGNIAGVVPKADGLTDAQMQRIAREMNVSETAFLMAPTDRKAHMRVRFFTPTSEIRLCGHATIASFHVLVEKGMLQAPAKVALQTNVGVLEVDVRADGEVYLSADSLAFENSPLQRGEIARMLGLPEADILHGGAVVRRTLFVRVSGLRAMREMRPDLAAIKAEYDRLDGLVPISLETSGPDVLTRMRFFAPGLGIDEDPVTGTAHMGLVAYLRILGVIGDKARFVGEQGHECGRPGRVTVEADGGLVRVGGRAVTTLEGRIRAH